MRPLSQVKRAQIIALMKEGFSQSYTARQLGINQSIVSRIWRRYQETGNLLPEQTQGRERITTVRKDRAIVNFTIRNPTTTARRIVEAVMSDRHISDQTCGNGKMYSSPTNHDFCYSVLMDKFEFGVVGDSAPGMTAVRYVGEILRPYVLPMNRRIGRNFILMQDNARPHTARITRKFMAENSIRLLPHPAVSPDLNPIEHVWDIMGRRLRNLTRQPVDLEDLSETLIQIWNDISQKEIRACINIRNRLQAVIQQRGGNT
ncbi:paired box protein Pax-2a-like [Cardiocondyla obscurior]|uniref:paired box protein Pax-2a-like n=1 Tax=Cardiocondyla obscurior TaxID=286306 RepID=UPI0039656C5A